MRVAQGEQRQALVEVPQSQQCPSLTGVCFGSGKSSADEAKRSSGTATEVFTFLRMGIPSEPGNDHGAMRTNGRS
jgi:hypothetical protein